MGLRKEGILQVDDVGTTALPVDATIVAPLPLPVTEDYVDRIASAPTFKTVGVSDIQISPANLSRKGVELILTNSGRISLAFDGATAVLDSGKTIFGPGGRFFMDRSDFTTGEIRGIGSAAGLNVAIQEFT